MGLVEPFAKREAEEMVAGAVDRVRTPKLRHESIRTTLSGFYYRHVSCGRQWIDFSGLKISL